MAVAFQKPVTRWTTVLVSGALVMGWLYSRRKKRKINETSTRSPSQRFTDKTVLITGAAGDIGSSTAAAFAREGATLVLVDLPDTGRKLEEEVHSLLENGARKVKILTADVTKTEEVQAMVSNTVRDCGRIDCFFNNAGIQGELLPLHEQSEEEFQKTIQVNLLGVFLGMKYVSLSMIKSGQGGVIVNTASLAGLVGPSNMAAYTASKFGVVGLTKTGAKDLAPHNIRVCGIAPGLIEGRLWHRQVKGKAVLRKRLQGIEGDGVTEEEIKEQEKRMLDGTPLGRIGKLSEVADVVVYLCSTNASYITGTVVSVDGGRLQ